MFLRWRHRKAGLLRLHPVLVCAALALAGCQSSGALLSPRSGVEDGASSQSWSGPHSGPLQPFKERAFQYRTPIEVSDGGRFMRVPYDELVDINKRDEIPVRKVRSYFVKRLPPDVERELEYKAGGRTLKANGIGRLDGGSKLTIIYLHGRGGDRNWGFDDERFGGNFNRLKNMILADGGAYISPDFTDFETTGLADAKALIAKFRPLTDGKLAVACGSLGNALCWELVMDPTASRQIDGLIVLAGFPDQRFIGSATAANQSRHVPLLIGHGSADPTYSYEPTLDFYRNLRMQRPSYPVRYVLFDTGKHGAPVRMIDWRDTLNWIAAQ